MITVFEIYMITLFMLMSQMYSDKVPQQKTLNHKFS